MSKRTEIAQGLSEWLEEATEEQAGCHCCCCTGECTGSFQDAPEWQQQAWLQNYWESVAPELFWPWIPAKL